FGAALGGHAGDQVADQIGGDARLGRANGWLRSVRRRALANAIDVACTRPVWATGCWCVSGS
ncbi:MAG TPA: hypothetical protein VIV12_17595, partial [Streptosporangiaceae bacterium]